MERLTLKRGICNMASTEFCHSQEDCYTCEHGKKCFKRLAAYEDTRLTPEEVQNLCPPVKPGSTVWTNSAMSGWYFQSSKRPYKGRVVFVGLNNSEEMGMGLFNVEIEKGKVAYTMQFNFSDIGKRVFLSQHEAEEALKH